MDTNRAAAGMEAAAKRVLFLSPFFYPEKISTGKYNTYLAKACARRNVSVSVIASHPLYPTWKPAVSRDRLAGIIIHRGGARVRYPKSPSLRRAILEIWFAGHVLLKALHIRKKLDIVVPVFPPNLFYSVLRGILPKSVAGVGIVHDLQGLLAVHSKRLGRRLISGIVRRIEGNALRACDRLIFLSHSMLARAVELYGLNEDKCLVCYPFATPIPRNGSGTALQGLFPPDKHHVVYSGALGEKQNPGELFAVLEKLVETGDDICAHIFSSGPIFESFKKKEPRTKGRLFLHDLVPEEDLWELYSRSTVQLIPQAPGTGDGAFPSKLPNLFMAGVPVVGICDMKSELASILSESGAGIAIHTWDLEGVTGQIRSYLKVASGYSRDESRKRLERYMDENFNIERVIDVILSSPRHDCQ